MQKVLSNTYIVWFKDCFETAEEAALALNGQTVFPLQHPQETAQSAVGRFLEQRAGYAKSLIQMVEPVAEYIRRENVFENTPCRSSNCYTAAVVIPPAVRQPENAALPSGTADILYLLQDAEYDAGSLLTVLAKLTENDTRWLYGRHRQSIFDWMGGKGLSLHDFGYNADVVLEQPDKVCWEVVYNWACDTVRSHLGSLK